MQQAGDRPYVAYMLRIWRVEDQTGVSLRASLEHAHSGERQSFRDLEALYAYLREQVEGPTRGPTEKQGRSGAAGCAGERSCPQGGENL